jgi:hypothetical protein
MAGLPLPSRSNGWPSMVPSRVVHVEPLSLDAWA